MNADGIFLDLAIVSFIVGVVLLWIWWREGLDEKAQQPPVGMPTVPEPPISTQEPSVPWWRSWWRW